MPIRGAEYPVTRVIATLQTYLPAEFDLLDAVWNDGLVLDNVENDRYYEVEMVEQEGYVPEYPAIVVSIANTLPLEMKSTTNSPGLYHAVHRIAVQFLLKDIWQEEPKILWHRLSRSAVSIERVLALKYPTLPSGTAETVVSVIRSEEARYILDHEGVGEFIRTATIPFEVMVYEQL